MKILVIGHEGMLGKTVVNELLKRDIEVVLPGFHIEKYSGMDVFYLASRPDAMINCAGVIPLKNKSNIDMIDSNSVVPHILADIARKYSVPLIHVSTDCVFSGNTGSTNTVLDIPDPRDIYGASKRLGEMLFTGDNNDSLITVFRTSFVGPDHGLMAWIKEQPDGSVINGWANAYWSGSTVNEVAKKLVECSIISVEQNGLRWLPSISHLSTSIPITKFHLLSVLIDVFNLNLRLQAVEDPYINRSLTPTIEIESFVLAINELRDD